MDTIIINFITSHQDLFLHIGIFVVFFVALLESTPFFGFIVPAQTTLVLSGAFSNITDLKFFNLFFFAVIGSIMGDIISFFFGKKYGLNILTKYGEKFLIKKEYLTKTTSLLNTHLGKTLFWGRISSIPRSLAPFIAGSIQTNFWRFFIFSSLGGLLWSFLFLSIGYIFAGSFEILGPAFGKFLFIVSLFLAGLISILVYIKKRHFALKKSHFLLTLCLGISLFIFSILARSVTQDGHIKEIDIILKPLIENLRTETLTTTMIVVTELGDKIILISLTLLISVLLFIRRHIKYAILLLSSMFLGSICIYIVKTLFNVTRPPLAIVLETSKSFPSGHAALSGIFAMTLYFIYLRIYTKKTCHVITFLCALLFPLLIGFSRLYLGVHWFSDVVGGFLIAISVITFLILSSDFIPWIYKRLNKEKRLLS